MEQSNFNNLVNQILLEKDVWSDEQQLKWKDYGSAAKRGLKQKYHELQKPTTLGKIPGQILKSAGVVARNLTSIAQQPNTNGSELAGKIGQSLSNLGSSMNNSLDRFDTYAHSMKYGQDEFNVRDILSPKGRFSKLNDQGDRVSGYSDKDIHPGTIITYKNQFGRIINLTITDVYTDSKGEKIVRAHRLTRTK